MPNILVLTSNKKGKCGIKEYTERIFNSKYQPTGSSFELEIQPITFLNCIKSPFSKFNIIHLQHEFFLFDSLVGISGLLYIIYFKIAASFTGKKLVTTVHSVHNPDNLPEALPHFSKFKVLFPTLSIYLKFYYYCILKVSQKTIVLSNSSAKILEAISSQPNSKSAPKNNLKNNLANYTDSGSNSESKIVVLAHGVFPRLLDDTYTNLLQPKFNIPENARIFTLFGFAFENKGYHLAIQALAKILQENSSSNIHLMVVSGEASGVGISGREGETYLQYLERLTKELGLSTKVHFTGFLDYTVPTEKDLLAEIFTKTKVFLFPYFNRTNASGALASVLSYAKPILVSDINYFQEFPFLPTFKEGNVEDLVAKMSEFEGQSEKLYNKVSSQIGVYIEKNSLQGIFNQQLEIYQKILD